MKFSAIAVASLLVADQTMAFMGPVSQTTGSRTFLKMAMDMPPAPEQAVVTKTAEVPTVTPNAYGQPSDVRYSDFLKLVDGDKIEKVTFSADGTQLLGVDVDGTRLKIETLPNDPDLLTQLTAHKVCVCLPVYLPAYACFCLCPLCAP